MCGLHRLFIFLFNSVPTAPVALQWGGGGTRKYTLINASDLTINAESNLNNIHNLNTQLECYNKLGHNMEKNASLDMTVTVSRGSRFQFDMVLGKKDFLRTSVLHFISLTLFT